MSSAHSSILRSLSFFKTFILKLLKALIRYFLLVKALGNCLVLFENTVIVFFYRSPGLLGLLRALRKYFNLNLYSLKLLKALESSLKLLFSLFFFESTSYALILFICSVSSAPESSPDCGTYAWLWKSHLMRCDAKFFFSFLFFLGIYSAASSVRRVCLVLSFFSIRIF